MIQILQINQLFIRCLLIIGFLSNSLFGQEKKLEVKIWKNPINQNYWWLEKNNFGITPSSYDLQTDFKSENNKTTYQASIYYQLDNKYDQKLYINESFIKHQFSSNTYLRIGRYYRDFSLYLNDELSSGSMLISHNAQAMPKIGLVSSKSVNKKIDFRFGIAHGFFDKNELYNKAPLLHEKFLYLNIKNKNYQFGIGFVHEAMWGGSTLDKGQQPDSFDDFLRVFIAADRKLEDYGENVPETHLNALGNHLGIWDFSFQKKDGQKKMKLYYQHIFDDTSGLRFANQTDGLWGIELKNYIKNNTTIVEYMNTSNYNIDPPYVDDRYYYHHTYGLGWSYKNFTLGTPFIDHSNFVSSQVLYLGSKGTYRSYQYKIKLHRKINTNDIIRYRIELGRSLSKNLNISAFIINNIDDVAGGFNISYTF